jgi:Zn finger protein HypA/HybF involved in hydrogenase expression
MVVETLCRLCRTVIYAEDAEPLYCPVCSSPLIKVTDELDERQTWSLQ